MAIKKSKKVTYTFDGYIDLEKEKVLVAGKRLREARAAKLGLETSRRFRGRPSLTNKQEISPVVQFRVSKAKKLALKKKARNQKISESELMRRAVDLILAAN